MIFISPGLNFFFKTFLIQLSGEVGKRLNDSESAGQQFVLTYKKRRPGEGEASKFLGHGRCISGSRSVNLGIPTKDPILIAKTICKVWETLNISPEEVRGLVRFEKGHLITHEPKVFPFSHFLVLLNSDNEFQLGLGNPRQKIGKVVNHGKAKDYCRNGGRI